MGDTISSQSQNPKTSERFQCPNCGAGYRGDTEKFGGKTVRCLKCGQKVVLVPPSGERTPIPAATPSSPSATLPIAGPGAPAPAETKFLDRQSDSWDEPVTAAAEWAIGQVIADLYEITALLGEGGMGRVYKVRHLEWRLDLAVKAPKPEIVATRRGADLFVREAETWVNLELHPHIVSCYYVRRIDGRPIVFAEYVSGGSLHDWIHGGSGQPGRLYAGGPEAALARILDFGIQMAWGLAHAHGRGLIHLDIKPGNIMIGDEGAVKVTDFGMARAASGEIRESGDESPGGPEPKGQAPGTPQYFSPEQARRQALDPRTDMWSWALCLLEMLKGTRTWESGTVGAQVLAEYEAAGPAKGMPKTPGSLMALLKDCLAMDPGGRPRDMNEAADRLAGIYREATGTGYPRIKPKVSADTADNLNNRALSMLDLDREEDAEKFWSRALEVQPHHEESTGNYGLWAWRRGRLTDDALIRSLSEVGASGGDPDRIVVDLAHIHLERGDCQSAAGAARSAGRDIRGKPEFKRLAGWIQEQRPSAAGLLKTLAGHEDVVHTAVFRPDGLAVLSGGEDRTARLWDVRSGQALAVLKHPGPVRTAVFIQKGRYALTGGGDSLAQDFALRLWDLEQGRCVRELAGHEAMITGIAVCRDLPAAVSASEDGTARCWDLKTGQCGRIYRGHGQSATCADISPDGKVAVSGGSDRKIHIWDTATGEPIRIISGHGNWISSVSLSPDGKLLLSSSLDRTLKLWDMDDGRLIRTFSGHLGEVNRARLVPGEVWAVSAGSDGVLRQWTVDTGRCLRTFEGHQSWVMSVGISRCGRFAASGSVDRTVRIWRIVDKPELFRAPMTLSRFLKSEVVSTASSEYEKRLEEASTAFADRDMIRSAARIRNARALPGFKRGAEAMRAWGDLYRHLPKRGFVGGWDVKQIDAHPVQVECLRFHPDGRFLLSGGLDGTLKIWSVPAGEGKQSLTAHPGGTRSLSLSADGRLALSGGNDGRLILRDLSGGREPANFVGQKAKVAAVDLSRSGRLAVTGAEDGRVQLWDTSTGRPLGALNGHRASVNAAAFSPDERLVLTGGGDYTPDNNVIHIWDADSRRSVGVLNVHRRAVEAIVVTPDARFSISGGADGAIVVAEIETGQVIRTMQAHEWGVQALALSGDGRYLLSGGYDRVVRLWEVASGQCLRTFEGHLGPVTAVDIAPDGRWAASGDRQGRVLLWMLDWDLEEKPRADWDEAVEARLLAFVERRKREKFAPGGPSGEPLVKDDLAGVVKEIVRAGFGWVAPESIQRRLKDLMNREGLGPDRH